jgi:hypothetical protein
MGLKETKEAIDFAIALGQGVENALSDEVITLTDIPSFFPSFVKLVPAIEGADQIALEFKLASQEEIDELKAYVNSKLELNDKEMEKFIEDAFGLVLTVWSIVKTYFIKPANDTPSDDEVPTAPAVE